MDFHERSSFGTIVSVIKHLSCDPGQARKRRTVVSRRVVVDRALALQMLNARLARQSPSALRPHVTPSA
jgi:hypothetical protein